MKLLSISCTLLLSAPLFAETANPYAFTIHVVSTRIDEDCGVADGRSACKHTQVLWCVVEGRRFQLLAETILKKGIVPWGDYPARLIDETHKSTTEFTRGYTIRFPDGSTRDFQVIGEEEIPAGAATAR